MVGKDIPPASGSDKDAERNDASPDAGAETGTDSGGSAPEVEAEIVETGGAPKAAAANVEAARVEPDIEDSVISGEASEGSEPVSPSGFRLSPGLILFFAFVALAVVITAIWGAQRKDGARQASPGAVEQPGVESVVDDAPPAADDGAETGAGSDAANPAESVTTEDKISNDGFTSVKDAIGELPLGAGADRPDDGSIINQLPPAPQSPEGSNSNLQDAAKAAAKALAPVPRETLPEGEIGGDRESGPGADIVDPPAIEFPAIEFNVDDAGDDGGLEEVDPRAAIETAPREARAMTAAQDLAPAPADDAQTKIANDMTSLKQEFSAQTQELKDALAEERQRSERQATQIAMLRESLEQALAERDAQGASAGTAPQSEGPDPQEGDFQTTDRHREASALALFALQRAADRGDGFAGELANLRGINPGAPALSRLEGYADGGAPTIAALTASFEPAAEKCLAASIKARASGPMSRVMANLGAAISVRPATPQAGDTPAAILSRAEARLENGDLTAALTQLDALDGPAAEAFAPWLAAARRRANVDAAIDALGATLLRDHLTQ